MTSVLTFLGDLARAPWSWPGAALGLLLLAGLALVVAGLPARRQPGLVERLEPYLRDAHAPRPGGPQEEGRRHPPRQRLVGPRPAPPDARLRGPRDGHLRSASRRTTRSSSSPRSCRGSGSRRSIGDGITSVVGLERLIKQIQFPKIVLPVAGDRRRASSTSPSGCIPLAVLTASLFYPRPDQPVSSLLIPVIAVVQLVFTLPSRSSLGAINVFYRDVGNCRRHVLRLVVLPVARDVRRRSILTHGDRDHPLLDSSSCR